MFVEKVTHPSSENREFPAEEEESCIIKDLHPSQAYDPMLTRAGHTKAVANCKDHRFLVILDVRTPMECSAGRIEGWTILDFRSPFFQEQLLALDQKNAYYLTTHLSDLKVAASNMP